MKVVLQRVSEASVKIENEEVGKIKNGLLILVGIENSDTEEDIKWICHKMVNMRIFGDDENKMNLSIIDVKGNILLVSQFTLHASTKKGNRPSFVKAGQPQYAEQCYEKMKILLEELLQRKIECGKFGADMQVSLVNNGPVTIVMDSKMKE